MAVAWIGSQSVPLSAAISEAARLLAASNRAVFSLDSDVHGTRAAIALAERVGATYDHAYGNEISEQIELCTDSGGFFISPTEVRRRADVIVFVGDIPSSHRELIASWTSYEPDLASVKRRKWFHLQGENSGSGRAVRNAAPAKLKGKKLSLSGLPLSATINVVSAQFGARKVTETTPELGKLTEALKEARFPVFVYSSGYEDSFAIPALQGLVKDINKNSRASTIYLPADDGAWGTTLTSVWMAGFPPRTSFATGKPVYDPILFDVQRMIAADEADIHFWLSEGENVPAKPAKKIPLIATSSGKKPVAGAAVSFAVGRSGVDYDGVIYSSRIGTFRSLQASAPSEAASIAHIVRNIATSLPNGEVLPC